jgi:hypothetical protein
MGLMPRKKGVMVHMTKASYPEIPMCQSGKSTGHQQRHYNHEAGVELTPDADAKGSQHGPEDKL